MTDKDWEIHRRAIRIQELSVDRVKPTIVSTAIKPMIEAWLILDFDVAPNSNKICSLLV